MVVDFVSGEDVLFSWRMPVPPQRGQSVSGEGMNPKEYFVTRVEYVHHPGHEAGVDCGAICHVQEKGVLVKRLEENLDDPMIRAYARLRGCIKDMLSQVLAKPCTSDRDICEAISRFLGVPCRGALDSEADEE